jgi:hypothetical protein
VIVAITILARFDGRRTSIKSGRGGPRGAVAPKYRNPDNPAETWAGRGLKPRWMAAALKSGRKMDDFLIAGASATKQPKKSEKRARRANNLPIAGKNEARGRS